MWKKKLIFLSAVGSRHTTTQKNTVVLSSFFLLLVVSSPLTKDIRIIFLSREDTHYHILYFTNRYHVNFPFHFRICKRGSPWYVSMMCHCGWVWFEYNDAINELDVESGIGSHLERIYSYYDLSCWTFYFQ